MTDRSILAIRGAIIEADMGIAGDDGISILYGADLNDRGIILFHILAIIDYLLN